MAFMKKRNACDNCGKNFAEVENPVREGKHEFCSEGCKDEYNEEHEHEEKAEEEVCEFC